MSILILIGKSGCGKDSLLNQLTKEGYNKIVSYTNRPIRENEQDGFDYHFRTKQEMLDSIKDNEFFQYRQYNTMFNNVEDTWYYGSKRSDIKDNEKYIVIVDLEGGLSYIEEFGERAKILYINVDDEIREERAKKRGSFCQIEWDRRLKDDNVRFDRSKISHTFIDNHGKLEDTIKQIKEMHVR